MKVGVIAKLPVTLALRLGLLGRWLAAQDPRRLCKRLQLEGFEHLVAANEDDGPLLVAVPPEGPWPAVLWVLAYYRGPVAVEPPSGGAERALAGLRELGVTLAPGDAPDEQASRLAVIGESERARLRGTAAVEGKGLRVTFAPNGMAPPGAGATS